MALKMRTSSGRDWLVRHRHKDVGLELGLVLPDSLDHRAVGYMDARADPDPVADPA